MRMQATPSSFSVRVFLVRPVGRWAQPREAKWMNKMSKPDGASTSRSRPSHPLGQLMLMMMIMLAPLPLLPLMRRSSLQSIE